MGRYYTAAEDAVVLAHNRYEDTPTAFQAAKDKKSFINRRYQLRKKQPDLDYGFKPSPQPVTDKKIGSEVGWREYVTLLQQMQEVQHERSWSQDRGQIDFSQLDRPICVLAVSDFHLGSWGTDYDALCRITEEVIETPNLYIVILGDMEQMSIKLRNVLEVSDNAIPPEWQLDFLESWVNDVADKTLFATWDNHSVMREESAAGRSAYKRLMSRKCIYFNGIGHADLTVGEQTYTIAASHVFRGRSYLNPLHAQMRYMRFEGQDREICMAGDSHTPGISKYVDGPKTRLALNTGALQINSGYAKRFFSLATHPVMPCFELHPDKHLFVPFWSVQEWLASKGKQAA